jgi:hypothetical protein
MKEEFLIIEHQQVCAIYRNQKLFLEDKIENSEGFLRCLYALDHKVERVINNTQELANFLVKEGFPQTLKVFQTHGFINQEQIQKKLIA